MAFTEKEVTLPDNAGKEAVMEDSATGRLHEIVCQKDIAGTLIDPAIRGNQDPLSGYIKVAYTSYNTSPFYDGYMKPDGNWYIRKTTETTGAGISEFCKGTVAADFTTAWADLGSQVWSDATIFA